MKYENPLLKAQFIRRYKRFFTEAKLEEKIVLAHTPNTGPMTSCLEKNGYVYLSQAPTHSANGKKKPPRKLAYTLELTEVQGQLIGVNTHKTNALVAEALENKVITEFDNIANLRREYPIGNSRFDFYYERKGKKGLIEVKNVTLKGPENMALFPDTVSTRALKHVQEMRHLTSQNFECTFLFVINRPDLNAFSPAFDIDPAYAQALKEATSEGVQVLAYQCIPTINEHALTQKLPVKYIF